MPTLDQTLQALINGRNPITLRNGLILHYTNIEGKIMLALSRRGVFPSETEITTVWKYWPGSLPTTNADRIENHPPFKTIVYTWTEQNE